MKFHHCALYPAKNSNHDRSLYINSNSTLCGSLEVQSGPVEADGLIGWASVECTACRRSWQDVWSVIDITEILDKDGNPIKDEEGDGHGE